MSHSTHKGESLNHSSTGVITKRTYSLVTLAYWAFMVTDGALRMVVLLQFHKLGFSPVTLSFLFLLYEFAGVITNLFGGWLGATFGLRKTLFLGLISQIVALCLLTLANESWSVITSVCFVMGIQALAGVAKDLTKMSSKSSV
ncbi:MFS transporter, partial [Akkermansiaceae bacterium]|nr:MFS transporter [Akkermansiaceae bacterium]